MQRQGINQEQSKMFNIKDGGLLVGGEAVCSNLDGLICGIILIDPHTRTIIYANKIASEMMGRTEMEIIGCRCHKFICPAEENECPILDLGKSVDNSEKVLIKPNDQILPVIKSVNKITMLGKEYLLESFVSNSKQKSLEEALRLLSYQDHLTGLRNRVILKELVQAEMNRSKRYQYPISIIEMDIDHFKSINDISGHLAGDRVLIGISQILNNNSREADIVFRWGGDEFLLLLPNTKLEDAVIVSEKIRKELLNFNFNGSQKITASFGLAEYNLHETWEELFERADKCLIVAKIQGRNQVAK